MKCSPVTFSEKNTCKFDYSLEIYNKMSPFAQLAFLRTKGGCFRQNNIFLRVSTNVQCCSSFLLP